MFKANVIVPLLIVLVFFGTHFFLTQTIYSKKRFCLLIALSILLPIILYLINLDAINKNLVAFSMIFFYYACFLLVVKSFYKTFNSFLINKKLVSPKYSEKDFTYVFWDGDNPDMEDIWDKKQASPPSWLDYVITYLLIILPFLLAAFTNIG